MNIKKIFSPILNFNKFAINLRIRKFDNLRNFFNFFFAQFGAFLALFMPNIGTKKSLDPQNKDIRDGPSFPNPNKTYACG